MELERILSQMADYTTDAIIVAKTVARENGKLGTEIVYVNKSFTALTGYTAEDTVGKSPKFLQGPKTDTETLLKIAEAIQKKKTVTVELLNYTKEGSEYWAEIKINPIVSPDTGECIYFLATKRDITERKTAETQLLKAIEKAEAANKAKSEFLANMSHELRTPMNGILGLAEIVQGMELDEDVRECVDAIHSSGVSLLTILNDILDLSKIEAEELELENYAFKTHDVLKNIRDLTQLSALRKNLQFNIQVNFDVPEWLMGDGKRIQQIIFNLIGNAIKFTETGNVTLSLDYKKNHDTPLLLIQVQDTGVGIPDEFHKNLFNKFSQADTSVSRKFGGTGLGLAITKHLVEMMGGSIRFTSKVNQGTTFFISIPIHEARQQEILQKTSIEDCTQNSLKGVDLANVRVLIVEDHPINQMLVVKWLKKLGVTNIDSAMNGFESLSLLRNNSYDFILMDCQMPELDGYETTSLIRDMEKQTHKRTPIIAMTANAMLGEREKCIAAGMDDYLSKPLNFSEFQSCVAKWVGAKPCEVETESSVPEGLDSSIPVDLSRLNEFTEGDKETEKMVIDLFLNTAHESLDLLKNAQIQGTEEEWKKAAHSFKGASGNLGAMALHSLCAKAEDQGDVPKDEKAVILSNIYAEFSKVENYLKGLN